MPLRSPLAAYASYVTRFVQVRRKQPVWQISWSVFHRTQLVVACVFGLAVTSVNAAVIEVQWSHTGTNPAPQGLLQRGDVTGVATHISGFTSLAGITPSRLTYASRFTDITEQIGSPADSDSAVVLFGGTEALPTFFDFFLDGNLIASSTNPVFSLETDFTESSFPSVWRAAIPLTGISGTDFFEDVLNLSGGRGDLHFVSNVSRGISSTGRFEGTGRILLGGDFSADGYFDVDDIGLLAQAIRQHSLIPTYDINKSGEVNLEDLSHYVHDYMGTWFGDSNLDGEFNSGDLVQVFAAGEYEDSVEMNSTWEEGDWNGSGDFDSGDLVTAFQDRGFEQGIRTGVTVVPEPSGILLISLALIGWMGNARKRS
ncbi:MAG: PEP-CTERM sorting domain-containing protein [Planctomycetales bacterium]|nr:PEP-CTERM sorting domain-containing protein [Planctomycetales bacterium]